VVPALLPFVGGEGAGVAVVVGFDAGDDLGPEGDALGIY
jgi:hypothetical protein